MYFKSKILTLPIKIQICIAIMALNLFCLLVILSICGSLAYEILKEDMKQKKLYFYEAYKEYIESCFYFHNFCLLQYEEIIKRIQIQLRENLQVSSTYKYQFNIDLDLYNQLKIIEFEYRDDLEQESNDNDYIFYHCFFSEYSCFFTKLNILDQYNALSSLVSSHNINKKFNIPMFDNIAIIENPIFFEIFSYSIFSFDLSKLLKKLKEIFGDEEDINLIYDYLEENMDGIFYELDEILHYIFINPVPLIELIFNKTINKIREENPDFEDIYENNDLIFLIQISNFFPEIDYCNNQFKLIDINDKEPIFYFYVESKIIDNYLYFMSNKLSSYIDIYFIPLYFGNNTIISPDLCILFLLKQVEFGITQKGIDELYHKIAKGESMILDCINNNEYFKKQLEIDDIFNLNQSFFIFISNSSISQGIVNLDNSNYYFMKYPYPNFNSLNEFKPEYFYKDQINFYLFSSFREPIKYSNLFYQISSNSFYLIILIIVYIWAICLLVNLFIYNKIIKQLIEPIYNLQEALISNSIKDKNIFEYEYDEFINELFLTCKEYLTRQIDRSNKGKEIDNLNHSSISKEKSKDTEENKYIKNLRVNYDIMNNLINQQKNLMDFSKYIETNENDCVDDYLDKSNKSSLNIKKVSLGNVCDNNNCNKDKFMNIIQNKNSFKYEKEEKEKENRESFKKLFQISEYFYYFLDKNKQNFINISDNELNSEISAKNEKSSTNNFEQVNLKYRNIIKKSESNLLNKDNMKSFRINMIDKNDISYLWYMEAKLKDNKSLNYKMGNKYDELFKDKV